MANYPRGSEWRKWDLHVHTPHSLLNSQFGTDFDKYARTLLIRAANKHVAAVGITDYFSVDGYDQLSQLVRNEAWLSSLPAEVADHARSMLILANVELRGFTVTDEDGRDSRVNYHLLFSDDLSAETIRDDFLARLEFTAAATPGGAPERWAVTNRSLQTLGSRLKEHHRPFRSMTDLLAGMHTAVVNHEEVATLLSSQRSRFAGKCLILAPIDEDLADVPWSGQGHQTRKAFIQSVHMILSANRGTREFALGHCHDSLDEFVAEFGSRKPCVHGSDAHDFDRLFEPDERKYCWIKGDPTWRGLAYLLNEPEDRVHIGPKPPQLEAGETRAARTMRSVALHRASGATTTERWFDSDVPLNAGICAIIGNRGNGKSALAEILALLGDTRRSQSFSFLTNERFRNPRIGKASQFQASVGWGDNTSIGPRALDRDSVGTAVERVRYIGQGFLEEICNEMDRGESSRFYQELQDVIFSHVGTADRRGQPSLAALLTELGVGIEQSISGLQEELAASNRRVLELSANLEPEYRAELEARLDESRRLLAAHDAAKPAEVLPPEETESDDQRGLRQGVEDLRADLVAIDTDLATAATEDGALASRAAAAGRLLDRIRAVEASVATFFEDALPDAQAIGIDLTSVIELTVDRTTIDAVIDRTAERRASIHDHLDATKDGLASRRLAVVAQMTEREEQLTLPQRQRQEYLNALSRWETDRTAMVGDATVPNSLTGLAAQLESLSAIPTALATTLERRRAKVREIYDAKARLKGHYEALHGPVSEFLASNPLVGTEALKLQFSADIVESGFADRLLAMIDQRRQGPFAGVDEGRAKIESLLREVDWSSAAQVEAFPDLIANIMAPAGASPRRLSDQLRQGFSSHDLLNLLTDLEYLQPTYRLTWDGRAVSELSPGERGNLLLIFYLLVDRNDIPLIIDQPEENLDNQTVYRTLVPSMRDARLRRQIVVVTHNPNLAVVCDADQVIYSAIDKDHGNAVTYKFRIDREPGPNSTASGRTRGHRSSVQ